MGKRRKGIIRYARPPEEHLFEKLPGILLKRDFYGYQPHDKSRIKFREKREVGLIDQPPSPEVPCIAVAFGWNADYRLGHLTADSQDHLSQVQRCVPSNFIAGAAGKHHSLLINNKGKVFSFGSGQRGQLGHGNAYNNTFLPTETLHQGEPKQITPTGFIHRGKDLRFKQVACGAQFSLARQISAEEALDLVVEFRFLEAAVDALLARLGPYSLLLHYRSLIRHERCLICEAAEGRVVVFGVGLQGQLGLGKHTLFSTVPTIIPALRHVKITKIAAGHEHSLAMDDQGYLYSWGSNLHGKLGLQDYIDRYEPERVRYLSRYVVYDCSAGDHHSAVLVRARGEAESVPAVCTFGRGAHGRLGNGCQQSSNAPVLVEIRMPSLAGAEYRQVACGGAHTLLLTVLRVPKTPSNPWGLSTTVLAWGFGTNGQLGDGKVVDRLSPVKAVFPKAVIVTSLTAGRSWSIATSLNGDVYTVLPTMQPSHYSP